MSALSTPNANGNKNKVENTVGNAVSYGVIILEFLKFSAIEVVLPEEK